MKAVAYYRNSINTQENSINTQQVMVHKKSIEEIIPIDEEFIDKDVSARKVPINKRPELQRLLKEIETGRVNTLFVYKRDRLARNVLDYLKIYRLLKEKEVRVIFAADNELPMNYSAVGELFETLMAGVNQQEGDRIVERSKATWIANFLAGKKPGTLPYGYIYDTDNDKIQINPLERKNIEFIFREILTENYDSLKELIKVLNELKLSKKGKAWTVNNVRDIVTNPTYKGLRERKTDNDVLRKKYNNLLIISEDDWDKANSILEKIAPKAKSGTSYEKESVVFLLEEMLTCYECNQKLEPNKARKIETLKYQCTNKEHKLLAVDKHEIETKVFKAAVEFFKELKKMNFKGLYDNYQKKSLNELQSKLKSSEKDIEKLNKRIANHAEDWLNEPNKDQVDKIKTKLINLYDQLICGKQLHEYLQKEILELKMSSEKIKEIKDSLSCEKVFLRLSGKQKKALLHDIVQSIIVSPFSIKLVFKHPFLETKEALESDT